MQLFGEFVIDDLKWINLSAMNMVLARWDERISGIYNFWAFKFFLF